MEGWQPIQGLILPFLHNPHTSAGWPYMWLHFNP